MRWIGLQLAALDLSHDLGQRRIGRCIDANLLGLLADEAIQVFNLGAPTLDHVLAHAGAMCAAARLLRFGDAVFVIGMTGGGIAFASAGDYLGV